MILFRIRDMVSTLFWRAMGPFFGSFGRRVRLIRPLRIVGNRYLHLEDDAGIQIGAYIAILPVHADRPSLRLRRGAKIGHHAHIICTHDIEFGEDVLTADRLYVADNRHGFEDLGVPVLDQPLKKLSAVRIGARTWIGENVCVIGASIGKECVIGANSVVLRDIPDRCVAAGSPAVPIRRYCDQRQAWLRCDPQGNILD
ncbi:DapH/DapD/GlmU-related protein [Sphingomonas sp. LT1P40]|uniref:DapH/DapD/GlmU-related protein n=1 Tax=Alteristakelama amylovorans TaxID=3096166 RepID=UPI002FC5ECC0